MFYQAQRTYLLLIFDGWGYRQGGDDNAIAIANTANWNRLWEQYPHMLIYGSGTHVGLPNGQMGNSEVGHLNLGAGRMVPQELVRINMAIESGDFFTNPALTRAMDEAIEQDKAVHVFGLLSAGGVHSHEHHLQAIAEMAQQIGVRQLYFHAFLDGRDTAPKSAAQSIKALEQVCAEVGCGKIISLCGRYYAMDRDQRWDRTKIAYDLVTRGQSPFIANAALEGLELAYQRNETDEFVQATRIGKQPTPIQSGDSVIFMNFRADRARQLTHAFTNPAFNNFERLQHPVLSHFVTLTEYATDIPALVAYPPQQQNNVLGEFIANQGLHQLRIAETEKYAHVTFFFNGGIEIPFAHEDRILIPSPKVATYDLQPQMKLPELTQQLVHTIKAKKYDLIVCNYANPDMVGHTGKLGATIQAIEAVDDSLGQVIGALQTQGGEAMITADHGNAEQMLNKKTGQVHTAHTSNPVPLLYIGRPARFKHNTGSLSDVAPSLLHIMGYIPPAEMTGKVLLQLV